MKCIWCLKEEPDVTFFKKAHTIPKSLGGQNFNPNVCDECNAYFGNRNSTNKEYSIEEALKEAFNISRQRFLQVENPKKKIGKFKSMFFEIKIKNNKYNLIVKRNFKFNKDFQLKIGRAFKRGLYKMVFEEYNRQYKIGYEKRFDIIRGYARYNKGDLPVFYFQRDSEVIAKFKREAEIPTLKFNKMNYLLNNDKFVEIEFLGHVFGFSITQFTNTDLENYIKESLKIKQKLFNNVISIKNLIDIDIALLI